MAVTTSVILGGVGVLLYLFYRKRKNETNVFKTMGVPGPDPHWLYGNVYQFSPDISSHETLLEWTKQYGKVFGYYEGSTPILVISDPDTVTEVLIRQFSNFHGRKPFPLDSNPDKSAEVMMLKARGHQWKRLRSIINPTFSSAKLKEIQPLMAQKADVLLNKFGEHAKKNDPVDVQDFFGQLTLDVIGESAFGLQLNAQENPNEIFLQKAKATFAMANSKRRPFIISVGLMLPELRPMLAGAVKNIFAKLGSWPFIWLAKSLSEVIEKRRSQKCDRRDLLQLMLDAEADEDVMNVNMWEMKEKEEKVTEKQTTSASRSGVIKRLTNKEIEQQGILFLLAGYETTSNLLSYVAYLLALHPDIQTTLQEEVDRAVQKHNCIVKASSDIEYLDMVIKETLRMYPVAASIISRLCMKETTVQGLHIPEGMVVRVDSLAMHYDTEIWGQDPEKFDPERFRDINIPPGAYIPFGAGPRNCVGMRFGLMEAKLTLTKILKEFTFEKCKDTQIPLVLVENATLQPVDGVQLKIVQRSISNY